MNGLTMYQPDGLQAGDPRNISALIVEDHPVIARGLAQYLVTGGFVATAHSCNSAAECLAWLGSADNAAPDIALVDFWLGTASCAELLAQLRQRYPAMRLLVTSADTSRGVKDLALQAGAHGFIAKQEEPAAFARAIAALLAGGAYPAVDDAVDPPAHYASRVENLANLFQFTKRQTQVVALALQGWPNKRIATELAMTEQTVKEHMTQILAKLGVANRLEMFAKFK